jgi:2-methylisocitrate lyase-like PEP mutase family enzyme
MRSPASAPRARRSIPTSSWSDARKASSSAAPDLDDVVRRLRAYADAGADCLYAPGIRKREQIAAVVEAVAPEAGERAGERPDRVIGRGSRSARRAARFGREARSRARAWGGFLRAATEIAERGTFEALADAAPHATLQKFFSTN